MKTTNREVVAEVVLTSGAAMVLALLVFLVFLALLVFLGLALLAVAAAVEAPGVPAATFSVVVACLLLLLPR